MFEKFPTAAIVDIDTHEKLEVCEIDSVGLGVRALSNFSKGTVLDRFTGEISRTLRQHSLQVGEDLHISGTRYVGYLTHGCDPNAWLDMNEFKLIARRRINAGELLTIDYAATEDRLFAQFACVCGAGNCRRWITGRKETINTAGIDFMATQSAGKARA